MDDLTTTRDALKSELGAPEAGAGLGSRDLDALFARVAADTVDRAPNVRDKVRELRSRSRVALAATGALVVGVVMLLLTGLHAELGGSQVVVRYAVAMTGIAAVVALMVALSLRGLHRRPLGPWVWVVVGAALLLPVVLAVTPWVWDTGHPAPYVGVGVPCLALGLVTGGLTGAVVWLFQRGAPRAPWRLLTAAAAGGLTAFAMLQLHCPARDATHLLVGHASVGLLLAAVVGLVVWLRARRG
ncbi:MAG: hypothetical protein H6745_12850 [Deltaproteobacteria bacterium]|nr:hypothetical protein [Deltaproteobacteria bacterium]